MSTLSFIEKECANCGAVNQFGESGIMSFNTPDGLDGNPGNLTPLYTAISICPKCHYASPDITTIDDNVKAIVTSQQYQQLASNQGVHELVRKYISWAFTQIRIGNPCEAARTMLYATWLSEQYDEANISSSCRLKAIELMSQCRTSGGNYELTRGKEIITMVDLYRREGAFADALDIVNSALGVDKLSQDDEFILSYEKKLCEEQNSKYATIRDAELHL